MNKWIFEVEDNLESSFYSDLRNKTGLNAKNIPYPPPTSHKKIRLAEYFFFQNVKNKFEKLEKIRQE